MYFKHHISKHSTNNHKYKLRYHLLSSLLAKITEMLLIFCFVSSILTITIDESLAQKRRNNKAKSNIFTELNLFSFNNTKHNQQGLNNQANQYYPNNKNAQNNRDSLLKAQKTFQKQLSFLMKETDMKQQDLDNPNYLIELSEQYNNQSNYQDNYQNNNPNNADNMLYAAMPQSGSNKSNNVYVDPDDLTTPSPKRKLQLVAPTNPVILPVPQNTEAPNSQIKSKLNIRPVASNTTNKANNNTKKTEEKQKAETDSTIPQQHNMISDQHQMITKQDQMLQKQMMNMKNQNSNQYILSQNLPTAYITPPVLKVKQQSIIPPIFPNVQNSKWSIGVQLTNISLSMNRDKKDILPANFWGPRISIDYEISRAFSTALSYFTSTGKYTTKGNEFKTYATDASLSELDMSVRYHMGNVIPLGKFNPYLFLSLNHMKYFSRLVGEANPKLNNGVGQSWGMKGGVGVKYNIDDIYAIDFNMTYGFNMIGGISSRSSSSNIGLRHKLPF